MDNITVDNFNELKKLGLTAAMITALFHKLHDRQFIIELENSVASFVDSNAESYELRPMNSYYRLLSHQVAEYHNLRHALARTHDNCVIIFKGDGFEKIRDKPLLQNLQPVGITSYISDIPSSTNNKRYRILKRRDGENQLNKNNSNTNQDTSKLEDGGPVDNDIMENDDGTQVSLEERRLEKEKQYEQRKQEIFSTPKSNGDDDLEDVGDNEVKIDFLSDNSPQPYQYETSRYKLDNDQMGLQEDGPPVYVNEQVNGGNAKRNRKRHSFYDDPRKHYSSNSVAHFPMPYYMYPTLPVAPANTGHAPPPQFPIIYPTPFPIDGTNGYLTSYMYQPIPGFGPVSPKGGMPPASGVMPGVPSRYMAYPFPHHQYAQPPTPTPTMYRQYSAPHRSHGTRYQKNSRNSSRSSFSRKSTEKQDYSSQDDTAGLHSSTSTIASTTTEIEELSHDIQKLPI